MRTSTYITLVIIYTLEAVLIVFRNALPIFVFWTERSRLKRTYFLLINLAVADLLVRITEFIIIGTAKSHNVGEGYGSLMRSRANPIAAFILLFSGTSVYFLALISMERAFAVLRPIRHRITNTGAPNDNFRKNICSEDDLRSRIFGTFVVKCLAWMPLLGFSNI